MRDRYGICRASLRIGAWFVTFTAMFSVGCAKEEKPVIPGLEQPVEILRDRWGIAHIYARNEHDLFLAQGYNTARDRLFQLELWRRRATGTLAEIQGPSALPGDIGARLLKFRGDMGRELSHYHPRGAWIVGAFVEGINAYIELTDREPERLPIEFRVLGIKPGKWSPEIVVSRHNGLYRNVTQEVEYARLVHVLGAGPARELLNLHPGRPELKPDAAVNLSLISGKLIEPYAASRPPIRFRPEDVEPAFRGKAAGLGSREATTLSLDEEPEAVGSNNWAISGATDIPSRRDPGQRSAPGRDPAVAPILGPPGRPRLGRDRRRRAGLAGRLGRPQRTRGLGIHHLPHRPGRPLRLRDGPRGPGAIPVSRRLGNHADDPGDHRGQGERTGRGQAQVHPARTGRV